jgi:hypothetical protein
LAKCRSRRRIFGNGAPTRCGTGWGPMIGQRSPNRAGKETYQWVLAVLAVILAALRVDLTRAGWEAVSVSEGPKTEYPVIDAQYTKVCPSSKRQKNHSRRREPWQQGWWEACWAW